VNRIVISIAIFVSSVSTSFASDSTTSGATSSECTLIVRFDDYTPYPLPGHSALRFEQVQRLFELFEKHHAVLVVGVVPFQENERVYRRPESTTADASWLTQSESPWVALLRKYVDRGVVEPALHGFTHRRTLENHRPGEFELRPQEWQIAALRIGRAALENALHRTIRGFVPPWNAWDSSTVRAMDDLGFEWLSPDLHHANADDTNLRIIPQCSWRPDEILDWIRKTSVPEGATIVLVTHPFDFDDPPTGETYFKSLDELLKVVGASAKWRCVGFFGAISRNPSLGSPRSFKNAVAVAQRREIVTDMFGGQWWVHKEPTYLLADANAAEARFLFFGLILSMFLTFAVALGLTGIIIRMHQFPAWLWSIALLGAFCAIVVLALGAWEIHLRGYHVRGIRWQFLIGCTGALVGLAMFRRPMGSRTRSGTRNTAQEAMRSEHEAPAR